MVYSYSSNLLVRDILKIFLGKKAFKVNLFGEIAFGEKMNILPRKYAHANNLQNKYHSLRAVHIFLMDTILKKDQFFSNFLTTSFATNYIKLSKVELSQFNQNMYWNKELKSFIDKIYFLRLKK